MNIKRIVIKVEQSVKGTNNRCQEEPRQIDFNSYSAGSNTATRTSYQRSAMNMSCIGVSVMSDRTRHKVHHVAIDKVLRETRTMYSKKKDITTEKTKHIIRDGCGEKKQVKHLFSKEVCSKRTWGIWKYSNLLSYILFWSLWFRVALSSTLFCARVT